MVSKNNRIQKMEQVAERQPHFGIRTLTVGTASVLLGTTLWLGTNVNAAHAEENKDNGDTDQAQESKNSTPKIDNNTQVVVKSNVNADAAKSSVEAAKSAEQDNNANSVKSDIQNNNAADKVTNANPAGTTGAAQSDVNATNESSKVQSVTQDVPKNDTNGVVTSNRTSTSNQTASVNKNSINDSVKEAQMQNAINKTTQDVAKADINNAAQLKKVSPNKGQKLDLSKLDLSVGEKGAGAATDANLQAQEKLAQAIKINQQLNSSNKVVTASLDVNNKENVDSKQLGASLIDAAQNGKNSDSKANNGKIGKVVVEATNSDNLSDTTDHDAEAAKIGENLGIRGNLDVKAATDSLASLAAKGKQNSLSDAQIAALFGMQLFQEGGENGEGSGSAGTIEVNGEKFTPTFNYTDGYKNQTAYANIPDNQYAYAAAINKTDGSTIIWTTDRNDPGKTIHFWINGVEKATVASDRPTNSFDFDNNNNNDEYHVDKTQTVGAGGNAFTNYQVTGKDNTSSPDVGASGNIYNDSADYHWIYQDGKPINENDSGRHNSATALVSGKTTQNIWYVDEDTGAILSHATGDALSGQKYDLSGDTPETITSNGKTYNLVDRVDGKYSTAGISEAGQNAVLETRNGITIYAKDVMDTPLKGIVTQWRKGGKYISILGLGRNAFTDTAFVKDQVDNDGDMNLKVYYLNPRETRPVSYTGVLQHAGDFETYLHRSFKPGDIAQGGIYQSGYSDASYKYGALDYNGAGEGNRDIVVFYKTESQPTPPAQLASNIEEATATQTVTRDVEYKNNGNDGQPVYNDLTSGDPNSTEAKRTEAGGLDNIDVPTGTKTQQTITLTGTAYFDKTTGKFVQAKEIDGTIYAIDSQGRPIVYDSNNNLVLGQLGADGKYHPTTERANYLQGGFTWKVDNSNAAGWTAPSIDGYKNVPSSVPALDTSIKVTYNDAKGHPIISGNATPTLQEVINYLNSQANTNQDAVSQDVIKDANDYPSRVNPKLAQDFNQLDPDTGSQYIFDQYQLTNNGHIVTLAVDRDNPDNGLVYVYMTDANYNIDYWNSDGYRYTYWKVAQGDNQTYTFSNTGTKVTITNFGPADGSYVSVNSNVGLKRIYGYGATTTDSSTTWGDNKPRKVTQTIKYVDSDSGQEIEGYPEVQVSGLIGQQFNAKKVNPLTIAGYELQNQEAASGSISDYQVGKTYSRTWVSFNGNDKYVIAEHHTLLDNNGTMDTSVTIQRYSLSRDNRYYLQDTRSQEGQIAKNGFLNNVPYGFSIQNPFVPSTSTVTLKYKKNSIEADQNPFYVVYTPTTPTPQEVQDTVKYIDDTIGKTLRTDTDDTLRGKSGDEVTYKTSPTVQDYENQGYKLVSNSFKDGQETFGDTGKTYEVHLAHKIDEINEDNPHGLDVTKTVTRTVNYTIDGIPATDQDLQPKTENQKFVATGHWDEVEHKVVDLVNGQEKVTNGKVDDGTLTWTAENSTEDSATLTGYQAPSKEGYKVNYVYTTPASVQNDNVENNGTVKEITLTHNSSDVTITINLTRNNTPLPQQVQDQVRYIDDTLNEVLRVDTDDNLRGKTGDTVTYTTEPTIQDYENQGYTLVSNDFKDGKETFGDTGKTYFVHLAHKIDEINENNPHGLNVTKTVTRNVYYTVDGVPATDANLQTKTESQKFVATGHWDEVEHKVVDLVNGQEKVTNGKVDDGTLTWTAENSTKDSATLAGYKAPSKTGYNVNNVYTVPTADKDANVEENGTVKDLAVTSKSNDVNVYINLVKNNVPTPTKKGSVNVIFHDTTTNSDINGYGPKTPLTGDEGTAVTGYTPDDDIKALEDKGYELDPTVPVPTGDLTSMPAKYTDGPQTVYINLKHGTRPVNPENPGGGYTAEDLQKTVTRTFHYVFTDGTSHPDVKEDPQTAKFTGEGTVDKVTGQLVEIDKNGNIVKNVDGSIKAGSITWTPADSTLPEVAKKDVTGYQVVGSAAVNSNPDGSVSEVSVNHNSSNIDVTVVYAPVAKPVAGDQLAHLTVIDNFDPQHPQELTHFDNSGKANTSIVFTGSTQALDGYIRAGYEFKSAKNDATGKSIGDSISSLTYGNYDNDDQTTQSFTIYLTHGTKPATPENPNGVDPKLLTDTTTETVHYVAEDKDGKPDNTVVVPGDKVQNVTWTRHLTVDSVTGQLVPNGKYDTAWNSADPNFKAIDTPVLKGYYADKASVPTAISKHGDQPKTILVTKWSDHSGRSKGQPNSKCGQPRIPN